MILRIGVTMIQWWVAILNRAQQIFSHFHCDETGLYIGALPGKTLSSKAPSTKGMKNMKEHMMVIFVCSSTGDSRRFVTGNRTVTNCDNKTIK